MLQKKKADLQLVDRSTGEILEGEFRYFEHQASQLKEPFMFAFMEGAKQLAANKDLTLNDHRVYQALLSRLDFKNWILLTQREIADLTGIAQPHVSKAMKKLLHEQIIEKGPKKGNYQSYRLNSVFAWKGKIHELRKHQQALLKLVKPTRKEHASPARR